MKSEMETLREKLNNNKKETAAEKNCNGNTEKTAILEKVHDAEECTEVVEASTGRKAVVMIACLYIQMCVFGLPTSLGVMYAELVPALGVPRVQAALVQSLCMGGSLVGGVFLTGTIRRFGLGKCVILASAVGTVSMMLTFFATNIQTIIVSVGLISGLALSVLLLVGFVAVGHMFNDHRRVATAALTLGGSVGQVALPNISQVLIYKYNWNGAFLILSGITMLNCVPCGIVLWCSKQYLSSEVSEETQRTQTWKQCAWLGDIAFVLLVVIIFISHIFTPIEHFFTVDLAVMKGFSATEGAGLLSINGWFGLIGRVILTLTLKCFPNTASDFHLGYGFVLVGICNFFVIYASTYWAMVLAISAHGLFYGVVLSIRPVMKLDIRGPEFYMESMAICNVVIGLANAISGSLGGLSVDLTGDYRLIFYIGTAVLVCSGFSMVPVYLIRKRNQKSVKSNIPYEELE